MVPMVLEIQVTETIFTRGIEHGLERVHFQFTFIVDRDHFEVCFLSSQASCQGTMLE